MDRDTKLAEYVRDACARKARDEGPRVGANLAVATIDLPSLIARFRAEHPEGGKREAGYREGWRDAGGLDEEESAVLMDALTNPKPVPALLRAALAADARLARPSPHPEGDVRAAFLEAVAMAFDAGARWWPTRNSSNPAPHKQDTLASAGRMLAAALKEKP